jgi:hypothetical protein
MPEDNPFVLLTFIAAPAILTNASSVLALNTANRYGRAFDRAEQVGKALRQSTPGDSLSSFRLELLERLIRRSRLLLRAQSGFYWAIGLFVLSALVSILGAAVGLQFPHLLRSFVVVGFAAGVLATGALLYGCSLIVRETTMAMTNLREERLLLVLRHTRRSAGTPDAIHPGEAGRQPLEAH